MKIRKGFTLVELLIAISLSALIILGLIQVYLGVIRYMRQTQDIIQTNQRVALCCNQIFKDLSTAYIPLEENSKAIDQKKASDEQLQKSISDVNDVKNSKVKKNKPLAQAFVAKNDDRDVFFSYKTKKIPLCKSVSFITTNPLLVYEEKKVRVARIIYEIVIDKAESLPDKTCYKVIRKETAEVTNVAGAMDSFGYVSQDKKVEEITIARLVKGFFVEYNICAKDIASDKEKTNTDSKEAKKLIRNVLWPDTEKTAGLVPFFVRLWIEFWNSAKTGSISVSIIVPIYSYPTLLEMHVQKDGKLEQKTAPQADQQKIVAAVLQNTSEQKSSPEVGKTTPAELKQSTAGGSMADLFGDLDESILKLDKEEALPDAS